VADDVADHRAHFHQIVISDGPDKSAQLFKGDGAQLLAHGDADSVADLESDVQGPSSVCRRQGHNPGESEAGQSGVGDNENRPPALLFVASL
jgi:hypothetical protein